MNATATKSYYNHARSLGAFNAADCLRIARDAAALDRAAIERSVSVPPAAVALEVLHDGSNPVHLSFGIYVF